MIARGTGTCIATRSQRRRERTIEAVGASALMQPQLCKPSLPCTCKDHACFDNAQLMARPPLGLTQDAASSVDCSTCIPTYM